MKSAIFLYREVNSFSLLELLSSLQEARAPPQLKNPVQNRLALTDSFFSLDFKIIVSASSLSSLLTLRIGGWGEETCQTHSICSTIVDRIILNNFETE